MINKQTTLDLNGPILSFNLEPSSVTLNPGGSAVLVGVATAVYPTQTPANPAVNTGSIAYQWYVDGYGPLNDGVIPTLGVTVTGTATTTLVVSNALGAANGRRFYVVADSIPSAYSQPSGSVVTVGTARSTGNSFNDPKSSNIATLTVNATLSITSNPSNQEVAEGNFATFTASGSSDDGTPVFIRWLLNGSYLSDNGSTIFGSNTNTLRISLPNASQNLVSAEISHPTASNSPLRTNSALFNVVVARSILNYETFEDDGYSLKFKGSIDLTQQPGQFFQFDPQNGYSSTSLYAPEKDINVTITLAGAAGGSYGSNSGGCGGVTVFNITLRKNIEYILKIGSAYGYNNYPAGGWSNGGGMSIFYRQSEVIAVSGGGGGAGADGSGGSGGSAGQSGISGTGRGAGAGGQSVSTGALGTNGYWQGGFSTPNQSPLGGKLSSCTIGGYWRNQGYSPCQNMGNVELYNVFGNLFSGSATIQRGFKTGVGYRNNGGVAPSSINGAGGGGAYAGNASTGSSVGYRSGGGGGSGYWNGEGTLVSAIRGGNCSVRGYVRIGIPQPPPPPPPPVIPSPSVTLTASPSSISQGGSSILSWSSSNATSVSSSNFGASTTSGSIVVSPASSTTYSITVSGPGGSASASASVTVTCAVGSVTSTYGTGFTGYLRYGNGKQEGALNGAAGFITSLKSEYTNVTITSAAGFNATYTSVAQTIFNYYTTNIGRYPETIGFDYWINDFRSGQYTSLQGLANNIDFAYRVSGGELDYQNANGGLVGNYDNCNNLRA